MAKLSNVLEKYYQALVSYLPMKDAVFAYKLGTKNLLPEGIIDTLATLDTSKEQASYFLDNTIKQKINEDHTPFDRLLIVMEESKYNSVKELAAKIRCDYQWCLKCMQVLCIKMINLTGPAKIGQVSIQNF